MRKLLFLGLLAGCASAPSKNEVAVKPATPGTIVAADSFRHKDGPNEFVFSVSVEAGAQPGVYTVSVSDGPRDAEAQFTMPKNGHHLPVFVQPQPPLAFVVGFKMPHDTAFYPYYRVGLIGTTIEMQYTHAYKL